MNATLALRISVRYLRGSKGVNMVPLLSRISMAAITVGSAALIILFSVFNGFETVVKDMYKAFYPDLRVSVTKGKFFIPAEGLESRLLNIPGIQMIAPVIEETVLINAEDMQLPAVLRGVDNRYFSVNNLKSYVEDGLDSFSSLQLPQIIVGAGIASQAGVTPENAFSRLELHYPNKNVANLSLAGPDAFQSLVLQPVGVFNVSEQFNSKYVFAPLALVQELLSEEQRISAIDIKLKEGSDPESVRKNVAKVIGHGFRTETRFEQNRSLYGVMRTEKWITYAILVFVLLIASVNMIGALSLLVLEKRKDIAMLGAMGVTPAFMRIVFLSEGILWALSGGFAGLLLGGIVCWIQQSYGLLRLEQFVIDSYPVRLVWYDFVITLITVAVIGLIAAWMPVNRTIRAYKRDISDVSFRLT